MSRALDVCVACAVTGAVLAAILYLSACTPPPPAPVLPDATGDASPCQVNEAINAARLIRTANGAPLVLPGCDGGAQ